MSGRSARMKAIPKAVGMVAVGNLCCFWIVYGLLMAASPQTSLSQFLGFAPSASPSHWFTFLLWAFTILSAPMSIMLDGVSSEHFMILLVLSSFLNAAVWGGCLGYPLHAFTKRFRHAASQSFP
jgi:hypothetical protein